MTKEKEVSDHAQAGRSDSVMQGSKSVKVAAPGSFSFVPEEWQTYKARFNRYMSLSGTDKSSDKDKIDCLLYCMGEKAEDIIIQFKNKSNYASLLQEFDNFFAPKRNVIFERYKFNSCVQKEGETVDDFITQLHKLSVNCEFGSLKEELIRDRLVIGIRDKQASERMLLKNDLTLNEATIMCRQAAMQEEGKELLGGKEELLLNRVKQDRKKTSDKCWFCGLDRHQRSLCPASKATCHNCQRVGHFAKLCRAKAVRKMEAVKNETVYQVSMAEQQQNYVIEVNVSRENVVIDTVKFLIDTGADVSAVPEYWARTLKLPLVKSDDTVRGPDGVKLEVNGTIDLKLTYKDRIYDGNVYVIKGLKTAILGRSAIEKMKIVSICTITTPKVGGEVSDIGVLVEEEFPNIFSELGVFQEEFKIKLIDNPQPYIQTSPRNISIPLLPKVKEELDRLEKLGIISPIEEPTDFVSPIVVVFKNNKVRICGDYTHVNKNILRPVYPIPKVETTLAKLKGAKYFSKIDATSGFHQIKLDDTSKKLTTIITPFGRYVYNRLPFGLNCAPEYFSMKFTNLFKDLKLAIHMDDILIYESTKTEHDRVLREVLKRLCNEGITINKNKCIFGVTQIHYLGHVINAEGIQIDPERIRAITDLKAPSNKKELLQFLGMVNFVGRFIANKSHILEPLHSLLKDNNMYVWGNAQEKAFNEIKDKLQRAPTLAHYDPGKKIIVSADSSSFGLGAALMQEDEIGKRVIVMYASRTLTDAEKHYAQIEKECLALVWAVEKFRDYVVGIRVQLETDHKPLLQILQTKPLDDLSPRLLRFRLKLTRFDYVVQYIPGKDQTVADMLSRQPLSDQEFEKDKDLDINMFASEALQDETLIKIQDEQKKCNICKKLKEYTVKGWPTKNQLGIFKNYFQYKNNFSIEADLLLYNSRIVIPESLQLNILDKIHEGHLGISRCRNRAKQAVWWLGLSKQIEAKVKSCSKCIELYKNHKEEMIIDPVPDRPWQKIGIDLFKHDGSWYIVMIDYYSRYLEIFKLTNLTEDSVIVACKNVFSRYGIPEVIRSDCGTQFKSKFNLFAHEYGFKTVTSSPYFSQSNGMAEAGVKIAKSLLSKNEDIHMALLIYRNTPTETGYSPAEMMFNRKLRDNLPIVASKLNKPVEFKKNIKDCKMEKKYKDAYYYNKRHKTSNLNELKQNERVWIVDLKTYGTIEKKCDEPRSYIVETNRGKFRRNRWHLIRSPDQSSHSSPVQQNDSSRNYIDKHSTPTGFLGNTVEEEQLISSDDENSTDGNSSETNEEEIQLQDNNLRLPRRPVRRPRYLDDYCTDY